MEFQTKAATQSLGAVSQALLIVIATVKLITGEDISAEVANLPAMVAQLVDAGVILGLAVVGLYGRLRANTRITGIFKAK